MKADRPVTIMVFARLFQGLADGLAEREWRPRGVPAIYKLLEALSDDPTVRLVTVFAAKDPDDHRFTRAGSFELDRLGTVHILPQKRWRLLNRLGLANKWRELLHLIQCLRLYGRYRPRIAYFTNAHFIPAGIIGRIGKCRSVFRFLGVTPVQHRIALGHKPLARWFYRAPFDQVVCTLDGSGAPFYLPRLLRPGVPCAILLNGVDRLAVGAEARTRVAACMPDDGRPVVLFVGKLERHKGCREFLDAAIQLSRQWTGAFRAVLLGDGIERRQLERAAESAELSDTILFPGSVPHAEVAAWLERADIYVSINKFGNISNANQEAMAAGKCMIVLEKDADSHIDEESEDVLTREAIVRIPRTDVARHLSTEIERLLTHPEEIERRGAATRRHADRIQQDWPTRIAREIQLIRASTTKAVS